MNNDLLSNRFLKEIYEQPVALKDTLDFYLNNDGRARLSKAVNYWDKNKTRRIIFTGMGSSFFIAGMASAILNNKGIPAQAINAGELIHYHLPVIESGTLLICISQSGESYEIVRILESIPKGITCIGICNEPDSALARMSHLVLLSKAGKEYMTSTKTYTATALVTVIFSLSLAGQWNSERIAQVRMIIESVTSLIGNQFTWLPVAMELLNKEGFVQILARGPSMAAAQQGALMFMEGARNPASALFSGEFRHGPMELVKEGFLVVILAPDGETYNTHVKLAGDIVQFGGKVIFLSNRDPGTLSDGILYINIPCADECFFSIPSIIPLQFMVNRCAVEKGSVPGEFLRGSKVTTIE